MTEGVDFSYARPGGAAIVAAGKRFVVRYIRPGDGRSLTAAEVADYHAHGLAICLVWESGKARALDGRAAGRADAGSARDRAAALGVPPDVPIYFAVDFNATPAQYPAIDSYLSGAAEVIGGGGVGVYGHRNLMAHCAKAGTADWFWQTYAWSGGQVFAGNHLYQYRNGQSLNGGAVDYDRTNDADYGQWDPPGISAGGNQPVMGGNEVKFINLGDGVPPDMLINVGDGHEWLWLDETHGGTIASGGAIPWLGKADSETGKHVVQIKTAVPYADKVARPSGVLLVSTNLPFAAPVPPPVADDTPFSQTDLDAKVAAEHERVRAAAIAAVEAIP